jgi:hypothetical protein
MKKTFKQIEQEIRQDLMGSRFYDGETATEEILTEIIGQSVECYDSCIDDGIDDEDCEDTYVYKDCFQTKDGSITIRVYYGDNSREITYVSVTEE